MICNVCGQNEATIHLTEILNDQMVEVHLCEACAEQKGSDFKTHFDFNKLLASLSDLGSSLKTQRAGSLVCESCGMTYEDFGRTGRLGCEECYQAFQKALIPLLKRIQRGAQHIGKVPSKVEGDMREKLELRELREQLQKSISIESFEEAAKIRDQIQDFENKMKKTKKKKA